MTEQADLRGFLSDVSTMIRDHGSRNRSMVYVGIEDLVLQHGRYFDPQPLPEKYADARATPKECFGNALELMVSHRDLTYCEGYAVGKASIPVHHAWCCDADGKVIDPTWDDPEDCTYYGVPLRESYVLKVTMDKKTDTVFDWTRGKDLFDVPLPTDAIQEVK